MGKDLKGKELGKGISQRKNGTYQGRYIDRFGNRRYLYDNNIKELRKKLNAEIVDDDRRMNVRKNMILDDWFERWIEIYKVNVRPNTKRLYVEVYKRNISPYIGRRELNSLVKSDIQMLITKAHEDGYAYERQDKIRVIIKDMLQRAVEDNLLLTNPSIGVKTIDRNIISARALTIEEQNIFFEFSKNTFYDNLFNVAVNTGLRPGELFALTFNDIDLENGYIDVSKTLVYQKYLTDTKKTFHIEEPKTVQSFRKVPINSICREYIIKQLELKEIVSKKRPKEQNDYIFVTKFNTPLNAQIYNDAIRAVIRKINLLRSFDDQFEEFSGHTLRHTFATRCFESNVPPKVVQKYLGHASLKMTMDLYTHVTENVSVNEIEKIVPGYKDNVVNFVKKAL